MLLALVGSAAAQLLSIGGLDGQLGFGTTFENQDISQPQQRRHLDRLYFQERVGVRTRGYFYDPDLLRFVLGGEVGLFQDHLNTDGSSLSGDGTLTGYDAEIDVLGAKPYGFGLFGHRGEGFARRDFAGQVKTNIDRYGVNWRLQNLPLPSYVTFEQQEIRQRFTLFPSGVQQDESRRVVSYYGEQRTATSTLTADYRFDDVVDHVLPQGAFQVHSAGLLHLWRFGDSLDDDLSSDARVYYRGGDISGTTAFEREGLHLRHSRDFTSDYSYTFTLSNEPGTGTTTSHNGFAGAQYQFYKSIVSSANVNAAYTSLAPGRDVTYGGGAGVGYSKELPVGAIFTAGIGATYQVDDRNVPSGELAVVNEPHTFPPEDEFLLANLNVTESTIPIRVTDDPDTSIVYQRDVDYFIDHPSPRVTRVRRNPISTSLAPIPLGGHVLVSYDFMVSGHLKVGSRPINFNADLEYKWVSLFYSGQRLRQDIFAGNASDILGPIDTDTMGLEMHWRRAANEVRLLNEYLTYDANDLSYSAFSFTQSAAELPRRWLTLGLTGTESFYDFSFPRRSRTFFSERGSIGVRPFPGLSVDAFLGYRFQRETSVPRDQLAEFGTHARLVSGLFTVSLGYDHAVQDIGAFSRVGDLVRLDVTRRF